MSELEAVMDEKPSWSEIPLEATDLALAREFWTKLVRAKKALAELQIEVAQKTARLNQTQGAVAAMEQDSSILLKNFSEKYGVEGASFEIDFHNGRLVRVEEEVD